MSMPPSWPEKRGGRSTRSDPPTRRPSYRYAVSIDVLQAPHFDRETLTVEPLCEDVLDQSEGSGMASAADVGYRGHVGCRGSFELFGDLDDDDGDDRKITESTHLRMPPQPAGPGSIDAGKRVTRSHAKNATTGGSKIRGAAGGGRLVYPESAQSAARSSRTTAGASGAASSPFPDDGMVSHLDAMGGSSRPCTLTLPTSGGDEGLQRLGEADGANRDVTTVRSVVESPEIALVASAFRQQPFLLRCIHLTARQQEQHAMSSSSLSTMVLPRRSAKTVPLTVAKTSHGPAAHRPSRAVTTLGVQFLGRDATLPPVELTGHCFTREVSRRHVAFVTCPVQLPASMVEQVVLRWHRQHLARMKERGAFESRRVRGRHVVAVSGPLASGAEDVGGGERNGDIDEDASSDSSDEDDDGSRDPSFAPLVDYLVNGFHDRREDWRRRLLLLSAIADDDGRRRAPQDRLWGDGSSPIISRWPPRGRFISARDVDGTLWLVVCGQNTVYLDGFRCPRGVPIPLWDGMTITFLEPLRLGRGGLGREPRECNNGDPTMTVRNCGNDDDVDQLQSPTLVCDVVRDYCSRLANQVSEGCGGLDGGVDFGGVEDNFRGDEAKRDDDDGARMRLGFPCICVRARSNSPDHVVGSGEVMPVALVKRAAEEPEASGKREPQSTGRQKGRLPKRPRR